MVTFLSETLTARQMHAIACELEKAVTWAKAQPALPIRITGADEATGVSWVVVRAAHAWQGYAHQDGAGVCRAEWPL